MAKKFFHISAVLGISTEHIVGDGEISAIGLAAMAKASVKLEDQLLSTPKIA